MIPLIRLLIRYIKLNNDIFISLKKGHTLLHQACIVNNLEGAKKLMIAGADPCKKDWKGLDSICYTIQNRNPELIQILLYLHKRKIHLNEQFTAKQETYLIMSAKIGSPIVVKIFLNAKANPNVLDRVSFTVIYVIYFGRNEELPFSSICVQ